MNLLGSPTLTRKQKVAMLKGANRKTPGLRSVRSMALFSCHNSLGPSWGCAWNNQVTRSQQQMLALAQTTLCRRGLVRIHGVLTLVPPLYRGWASESGQLRKPCCTETFRNCCNSRHNHCERHKQQYSENAV